MNYSTANLYLFNNYLKMKYSTQLLVLLFCFSFNSFGQINIDTPLEKSNFKKLSTNREIISYLAEISAEISFIKVDTFYETNKNKKIPFVIISNPKISSDKKIKVLILGQQHGNEPSGKEGLLLLIKEIAKGNYNKFLENIDLLIIPQANPDGGDANTRRNAEKIDMNRDHLILNSDENLYIHQLFDKYLPEVTIDIHEYYPYSKEWENYGYRKNFDIQIGSLTNINIDAEIIRISKQIAVPFVIENIRNNGFSADEYIVGNLPDGERLRFSTTDINDGRQSFGIENTFSFLIEGINGRDSLFEIEYRAKSQYNAVSTLLKFISNNHELLKNNTIDARSRLINASEDDSIILRMEHFIGNKPLYYNLLSVRNNKDTTIVVENFCSVVKPLLTSKKPKAYLIPKSDTLLLSFIRRNNFIFKEYKKNKKEIVKQYKFNSFRTDTIEEQTVYTPSYELIYNHDINESDYYYIPVNQLKSSKILLAFEPLSMYGLVNYKIFKYLINEGKNYPILRIEMKKS